MNPQPGNTEPNNSLAASWNKATETLAAYAAQRHIPLGATFEITARCNLRCKMCYCRVDSGSLKSLGRELTAKEWITLGEETARAGTLDLLITGGEPLIRPDFPEIYMALNEMGFIVTLYTNGTLITPQLYKLFSKYPPTATSVTLYGACPETYKKICGKAEAFEETIHGLEILANIPTSLEVRTTFIQDNMSELDALRAIANRYTKRFAINTNVFKPIRGSVTLPSIVECCRLTPIQAVDLLNSNIAYYEKHTDKGIAIEKNMETDAHLDTREFGYSLPPEIITCLAAKSVYWITWDGKMLPCGSFSSPYTLPLTEGFVSAWNRLPGLFFNINLPQECQTCEFANGGCPNCPANLQAETGYLDCIAPYICESTRERSAKLPQKQRTHS